MAVFMAHSLHCGIFGSQSVQSTGSGEIFTRQPVFPYQNGSIPLEQRLDDLMARMMPTELRHQLFLSTDPINRTGLTLPGYSFAQECLAGVSGYSLSSAFPLPINLGSTFDVELVHEVATAISDEARAYFNKRHVSQGFLASGITCTCLAPNLNVARDSRWGRNYETFGEDPLLISALGTAYINAMQGDQHPSGYLKVNAAPKHMGVYRQVSNIFAMKIYYCI